MEETRLKIVLNGDGEEVRDGRLSLAFLLDALKALLDAYRQSAAGIVRQAGDDDEIEQSRLPVAAARLDLELFDVQEGSTELCLAARRLPAAKRPRGKVQIEDLETVAIERLLADIDSERQGQVRNKAVRAYLAAIPRSVRSQRYTATRGDVVLRDVVFDSAVLYAPAPQLPRAQIMLGALTGACFEKDRAWIEIRTEGDLVRLKCTAAHAETAVSLRDGVLACMVLSGPESAPRLLWIERDGARWQPSSSAITAHVLERWDGVFRRLAQ